MRRRRSHRHPPLLIFCHVVILIVSLLHVNAQEDPTLDYSCGTDWVNAANGCSKHCPTGRDEECADLGEGHGCYYFTGCKPRFEELKKEQEELAALNGDDEDEIIVEVPPEQNQFCAPTFIEAMLECSKDKACPAGNECGEGEFCYGGTNCDRALKESESDMVFNLQGLSGVMEEEDLTIFKNTVFDVLQQTLSDIKIHLDTISVTNQRYFASDELLEVSVFLTAKYRPPPRKKLDSIVENSINLQKESVRAAIKQAGNAAKRWHFTDLKEISAVSRENATMRPTVSPTGSPTFSPTGLPSSYPTASPSESPSAAPSDVPSSMPSREHIQEVATATSNELKSSTDGSYGFVFNMRTAVNGPVVLITGLDFYTENTDLVGFELWSRLGSFKTKLGTYEGWDLIASGVARGAGYGKFTSIPSNTFTEVSIPGRGGERAFYLTLNKMDLIYKASEVESAESDSRVTASSPELEIYEGEAVLSYPFPDPTQAYLYRSPRLFVGKVQYDRIPCKPFSLYGPVIDLPCVEIPTMPPTKRPTPRPIESIPTPLPIEVITAEPTVDPDQSVTLESLPTMSPLLTPSLSPSVSFAPTISTSPTLYPTSSPMDPIRAYIVATLHHTLNRDMSAGENKSFFDMFVPFMRKHCKVGMMVENIDVWSEEQIKVAAPLHSNATSATPVVATRSVEVEGLETVQATKLTLVIKISSTTLPLNLLGNMAVVAIEMNQEELLKEIRVLGELYQFFENVDQVVSFSISSVTEAPVASPAEKETTYQGLTDGNISEESSTRVGVVTGVTVAILWILLSISSVYYLKRVRSKMKENRITNEEVEKIDPLNLDTFDDSSRTNSKQTSETDRSDRSGPNDGRRIGLTKMGLSRSFDARFPTQQGRLETLSRSLPIRQGQDLSLGFMDDSARSNDLGDEEIGLRQNLRSSLNRSGSHRDLNMRGSMRNSIRRSDGQRNLRASMQRSDSESNLRGSLSDSQRSGGQGSLRGSLSDSQRSGGQDNLRGYLSDSQRSGSQGNLRGSLRESIRRSDNHNNLRTSIRRSDSQNNLRGSLSDSQRSGGQGNLRGSLRESMRRSDGQDNLRSSIRRSDSQNNLRGSLRDLQRSSGQSNLRGSLSESIRRSDGQDNLRTSIRRSDSQSNLRGSLRDSQRSSGQSNLRGSLSDSQRSGGQGNLRGSLRESVRRNDGQDNLRSSIRRNESPSSPRGSLRDSQRSSGQSNLRGSLRDSQRSNGQGILRGSMRDSVRRSDVQDNLRSSIRRSGNEDLRGSGNNLRGSGNRGLRGSGNNELTVSFVEDNDNNVPEQGRGRNTDLSKSMTALVNWDIANEAGEGEDLRRSGSNIMTSVPQFKDNDNIGVLRRSTKKGSRDNFDGLKGSVTKGNDRTLRRSANEQRSDSLESSRGRANSRTGRRGDNNTLRRSGNKHSSEDLNKLRQSSVTRTRGNDLRSSGGRGRHGSLSQSMTALRSRSSDKVPSSIITADDNERPASHLRNSLRSSTRSDRPAMSESITRRPTADNERPASRLRNSTTSPRSGNNLRSSMRGDGLARSRTERPDSRLRSSSIEQRNYSNLRSSARGDRALSQSMRMSSDARDGNTDRRSGTRGDGKNTDSNFGDLMRQASARRKRRASAETDNKNDIEALKRNLIL